MEAHVFANTTHNYTGFVVSLSPPSSQTDPARLGDWLAGEVQNAYPSSYTRLSGRQIVTHDGYDALAGGVIQLPLGTIPTTARDTLLNELTGATVSHSLSGTIPGTSGEPTLFAYEVLSRSSSQMIVVGVLATEPSWEDDTAETGLQMADLTGGSALASASASMTTVCVDFTASYDSPAVDIILVGDASGSMQDEISTLSSYISTFTADLDAAGLDWRVGVTSVACNDIKNDTSLSQDFRDLWPQTSIFPSSGPCPAGLTTSGVINGQLQGGDFTTNASTISSRLTSLPSVNSEYTATMGAAAVDRALPRTAGDSTKIRPDAAVVVIAISDEDDEFFKTELSFLGGSDLQLTSSEYSQLETEVTPWIDYLRLPRTEATFFGGSWPPGESCSDSAQPAHAMSMLFNRTGGSEGSLCQDEFTDTLVDVARASAGIGSEFRLRGTPVPSTLQVKRAGPSSVTNLNRSRTDGYDYDGVVERVSFRGSSKPVTNDNVIISYRRWDTGVTTCSVDSDCPQRQLEMCVNSECR